MFNIDDTEMLALIMWNILNEDHAQTTLEKLIQQQQRQYDC